MRGLNRSYPALGHAILLCVLLVAFQTALVLPFSIADVAFKLALTRHPGVLAGTNLVAISAAIGLGLLIGGVSLRQVLFFRWVPVRVYLPLILIGVGAVIVLSEMNNLFCSVFPIPEGLARIFQELNAFSDCPWGGFLALVVVAPLTEEIFLRGLILPGLLNRYRLWKAIALSALLFAGLHVNPWQFISTVSLGALFGWYFVRTQSLWPCLLGHAFNNSMAFGHPLLPFNIRGFNTGDLLQGPEMQPLWFDALGIVLVVIGCWLFARMTVGLAVSAVSAPPPLPPVARQTGPCSSYLVAGPGELPPVINAR